MTQRCSTVPDDWIEFDLVEIETMNVPGGWAPIRYKSRDEFLKLPDKWSIGHYSVEGRQMFFGGTPEATEGMKYQIFYFAELPVFADTSQQLDVHQVSINLPLGCVDARLHACCRRRGPGGGREAAG